MPVIIQEIQITAQVGGDNSQNGNTGRQSAGSTPAPASDQSAVIAACVEEVMRILHEKNER